VTGYEGKTNKCICTENVLYYKCGKPPTRIGTCFGFSVLSVQTGLPTQQHRFTWMVIQYTIAHGIHVAQLNLHK